MDAKSWIKRVSGEAPATVAKKLGITPSTLDSQMKSANGLKPETVVLIARHYKADVVASLVELGLIASKDIGAEVDLSEVEHLAWLRDVDDDVLLDEIGRRLKERGGEAGGEGGTPAEPSDPDPKPAPAADDLAKKRTQRKLTAPPRTVRDTKKLVAKRSGEPAGAPIED